MFDKLKDAIFIKAVKLSEIDHGDPIKRSLFLMVDGKKTVSEIVDKLKISQDMAVEIINEFLNKEFIKPLFPEDVDILKSSQAGQEVLTDGVKELETKKLIDEKLSDILKNYLGPLSVTAINKDLASVNNLKLLKDKLISYTKYILDEIDKNEYLKEIEDYFKG